MTFQVQTNIAPVTVKWITSGVAGRDDVTLIRDRVFDKTWRGKGVKVELSLTPLSFGMSYIKPSPTALQSGAWNGGQRFDFTIDKDLRNLDKITLKGTFSYAGTVGEMQILLTDGNRTIPIWKVTGQGFDFRLASSKFVQGQTLSPPSGETTNVIIPISELQAQFNPSLPLKVRIAVNSGSSAVMGDHSRMGFTISELIPRAIPSSTTEQPIVKVVTPTQSNPNGITATPTVQTISINKSAPAASQFPLSASLAGSVAAGFILLLILKKKRKRRR